MAEAVAKAEIMTIVIIVLSFLLPAAQAAK